MNHVYGGKIDSICWSVRSGYLRCSQWLELALSCGWLVVDGLHGTSGFGGSRLTIERLSPYSSNDAGEEWSACWTLCVGSLIVSEEGYLIAIDSGELLAWFFVITSWWTDHLVQSSSDLSPRYVRIPQMVPVRVHLNLPLCKFWETSDYCLGRVHGCCGCLVKVMFHYFPITILS